MSKQTKRSASASSSVLWKNRSARSPRTLDMGRIDRGREGQEVGRRKLNGFECGDRERITDLVKAGDHRSRLKVVRFARCRMRPAWASLLLTTEATGRRQARKTRKDDAGYAWRRHGRRHGWHGWHGWHGRHVLICRFRCPKDDDSKTHIREDVGFLILSSFLLKFFHQHIVGGTQNNAVELFSVVANQAYPLDGNVID